MKNKTQNQVAVDDEMTSQDDNGVNGTTNLHLTEEQKEKGNLKKFNLSKKTIKKLKARNVEFLFPVQTDSYTSISEQNDCVIQAASGSGKTLAFVLPLVELLQGDKSVELVSGRAPRVLVIAPTKDSAKQISEDFESVVNDLAIATIFGGKKKSDDQEAAITNGCDVLVATPDRLKEFIDNEKVDLSQVKHVVLDEVDRITDSNVTDELKKTLKNVLGTDEESKAQLIVFSETFPDSVRKLTKKYLKADFATITVAQEASGKEEEEADAENGNDEDDEDNEELVIKTPGKKSGEKPTGSQSLLSKQENYTTYQLSVTDEIKGVGFVFTMLKKCFGDDFDAKGTVSQIAFTTDFKSAIFDLPSELDEQLQSTWKDSGRIQMGPITELPELDQSSLNDSSYSRGNNRPQRGGGGGNRNSGGRSNACFNCQKEGHKSWECPEANNGQSQRNGGNRSGGGGGGGCFNCGKDGHKSFECPEPKKAGGRPSGGGGGERSNACFNCGQEGHRSFECTEPKKAGGRGGGAGGRSNACFNCGQEGHRSAECTEPKKAGGREQSNACFNCGKDGHKSFECPEPKKGRPSFGGGGRGGGRGGSRGGNAGGFKRSFGGHSENGQNGGEASNKKIKFDDDDE